MEVYIGLDVSLASTAICVLSEKGKMVTEAQVASAPDALVSFLRKLPHGIAAIGLEAGPLSNWLHKGLTDAGFEAVLMEIRQVKSALKAMPIKTDRRDAEGFSRSRYPSFNRSDCYRLERQLPGGVHTRWVTAPFHGAREIRASHPNLKFVA